MPGAGDALRCITTADITLRRGEFTFGCQTSSQAAMVEARCLGVQRARRTAYPSSPYIFCLGSQIMEEHQRFGLAETIESLRQELVAAQEAGRSQGLRFTVAEVELEASIEVARSVEAKTGIKVWVVEVGAGGSISEKASHRLHLKLKPPADYLVGRDREVE